jgi:hypothetical protein
MKPFRVPGPPGRWWSLSPVWVLGVLLLLALNVYLFW